MKKHIIFFCLLIFAFSSVTLTTAHTPEGMVLGFDFETDSLTVRVNHVVSDVDTHKIELIQVYVNNVINETMGYATQTTTAYHEDIFIITAVHGDVIMVNATCNISGNIIDQITLDDPAIPEYGFLVSLMFFVVASLFVGWKIHRKNTERK